MAPIELNPEQEPPPGSVILLHGDSGTAVQRMFSDGKYHTSTGRTYTYEELFTVNPNAAPLLVHRPKAD